ncbi:MAG: FIST N-terminal domain-containing protein [Gallionella sp.]|nr:FIST N-terminal domain-containing protein [Gallionella sp.]
MLINTFTFKAGHGWSVETFPNMDSERTLVLIFAAPAFFDDAAPIEQLCKAYPKSIVMGCSTAGEISGAQVNDESLSVAVVKFEHSSLIFTSTTLQSSSDSCAAGEYLATQLPAEGLRGVFVLADGLKVNGSQLVTGLGHIPHHVPVTGGLAADGANFKRTWVIHEGRPTTGMVTAVGFYGDKFHMTHGARGGWESFGPERKVTRAENNILYELDGKPALALYKEYLGELANDLPSSGLKFPLAIRNGYNDTKCLIRTILGVNEGDQSLIFAGDVPENYLARLMRASFDKLVDGAVESAKLSQQNMDIRSPMLAVAASCVGRRLVLGEHVEDETEAMLKYLPEGTKLVGLYGYGGISPYSTGSCDFHNQTMMLTTFEEI